MCCASAHACCWLHEWMEAWICGCLSSCVVLTGSAPQETKEELVASNSILQALQQSAIPREDQVLHSLTRSTFTITSLRASLLRSMAHWKPWPRAGPCEARAGAAAQR